MDASTFFETKLFVGEAAAYARNTTRNVTSTVKSCRTFGRAFPFDSDAENFAAPGVAPYSWEGGKEQEFQLFIYLARSKTIIIRKHM